MPPEPRYTFFVDASLGSLVVPSAIRESGYDAVSHDQVFPQGTPDTIWLTEVGRRQWVVLTQDKRIRYRKIERRALESAGVAAFVVSGGDLTGDMIAAAVVKALPKMLRLLKRTTRPFIAVVTAGGNVHLVK